MNPEDKHIIDELKQRPAEMPGADYFAGLKAEVMGKIATQSERDHPPLSPLKGGDQLPPLEGDRGGGKIKPLYLRPWFQIAAAASVALIVTLVTLNGNEAQKPQTAQSEQPDWNSVSDEEVLAYIHENIDDFETETIAQHLDSIPQWSVGEELAVNAAPVPPKKENADKYDELFRNIEKEDILEYLEDEGELEEDLLF